MVHILDTHIDYHDDDDCEDYFMIFITVMTKTFTRMMMLINVMVVSMRMLKKAGMDYDLL